MSALKHPKIAGFQLYEQIGGGGFSSVYKAVNIENKRVAACKVVSLQDDTPSQSRKMIEKEIRVHSAMKHTNVLEFYNALIVESGSNAKYFPGIYMLLELASGGDLFDKIAPDIGIQEDIAQHYFNELIAGLRYIHGQGVCHRDLKPENLLLDIAGRLKISDFGLCSVFKHKESGKVRMLTERCGSLPYVAPELNSQDPYHAEPVDIWGTGVILFTLLAGNTPWDEPSRKSPEFVRYANGDIFVDEPWCRIGHEAMSLIKGILTINPYQRMTLADVAAHPWCMRPSQIPGSSSAVVAQKLIESLQQNGDMNLIDPQMSIDESRLDADDDTDMIPASYQSQFTQSLMLFSQTQNGKRYTPHLTRFYCNIGPTVLLPLVNDALIALGVKTKMGQPITDSNGEKLRLRVGGFDRRKEMFKGWVEIEHFNFKGSEGSFCVMQRDQGNPISWRQLWKALVNSPSVSTHVLRR